MGGGFVWFFLFWVWKIKNWNLRRGTAMKAEFEYWVLPCWIVHAPIHISYFFDNSPCLSFLFFSFLFFSFLYSISDMVEKKRDWRWLKWRWDFGFGEQALDSCNLDWLDWRGMSVAFTSLPATLFTLCVTKTGLLPTFTAIGTVFKHTL